MLLTGLSSSKWLSLATQLHCLTSTSSKKSKVQSLDLAGQILQGLMPITTEAEPEDIDDDAPSRVSCTSPARAFLALTHF
jgi:hypothetical protein